MLSRIRNKGAHHVLVALSFLSLSLFGEERTVSDANGLLEAVKALKTAGDVIKLEAGLYDLKDCEMSYNNHPYYHLVPENVRLVGKTGNARDVVLAGDGTHVVLYSNGSSLENLTISNGCRQAGCDSEYAAGLYTNGSAVHSNIVVTSCRNLASSAGGVSSGTFYDCLICNNTTVQSGGASLGGTFHNCVISNNTATSNAGGCYYGVKLYDCKVLDNTSGKYGGGVMGNSGSLNVHVYGGLVAGNRAKNGGGSCYAVFHGDTIVSNNTSTSDGGGVRFGIASNTVICCNTSGSSGGGVAYCSVYGGRIENY